MLFGLIIGTLYAKYGFGNEGETPKIDCSCGPIVNGRLYLCGYRIHHWMVAAPVGAVSFNLAVFVPWAGFLGCWDLMTFCCAMTVHGLTYADSCDTTIRDAHIEPARESELGSEDELDESEP